MLPQTKAEGSRAAPYLALPHAGHHHLGKTEIKPSCYYTEVFIGDNLFAEV